MFRLRRISKLYDARVSSSAVFLRVKSLRPGDIVSFDLEDIAVHPLADGAPRQDNPDQYNLEYMEHIYNGQVEDLRARPVQPLPGTALPRGSSLTWMAG